MNSNRSSWISAGLVIFLVVILVGSLLRLNDARAAALDAETNLLQMNGLVKRIETLRQNETRAMLQGEQRVEDSKTWIDCIRAAGIDERQINSINRLPIRRIDQTDYSRDDVLIKVVDITSEQVVNILLKCEDASMAYKTVSAVLARSPTQTATQDKWNLDILLTRLLYSTSDKKPTSDKIPK